MRPFVATMLIVAAGAFAAPQARAQVYPSQPVKIVVGLAAGGVTDSVARVIAQPLSEKLGQSFVIENRPGATGTIAAEQVARSAPDGYTLVMGNTPQMTILPSVLPVKYEPLKDFTPVANIATNPFALCINAEIPVNTVAEFIAYAKKQPGKLSYASGGVGNINHLSMTYFAKLAGLDMIHVPYKGGAPAMADVVAGHVSAVFASLPDALTQYRAGKVKILAVSSVERSPRLPDVPTVRESGFPAFRTETWNGLMAPAALPKPIVERLWTAVRESLADQTVIERLDRLGVDPVRQTPAEFAENIRSDVALWDEAITAAGIKATK